MSEIVRDASDIPSQEVFRDEITKENLLQNVPPDSPWDGENHWDRINDLIKAPLWSGIATKKEMREVSQP